MRVACDAQDFPVWLGLPAEGLHYTIWRKEGHCSESCRKARRSEGGLRAVSAILERSTSVALRGQERRGLRRGTL